MTRAIVELARRRRETRDLILSCVQCPLRDNARPYPVPFHGPFHPAFIVLGDAPDQTDHRRRTPFSGPHGRMLRRLLAEASLRVDDALLVTAVCCNPWGTPSRDHLDACRPHLEAQLGLAPAGTPVLAVGQVALSALASDAQLRGLHGSVLVIDGRPVMPIHHPAYLLRDPTARPAVREALRRFASLLQGLGPEWFRAEVCSLCAEAAVAWDHRQMPFCRRHEGEIRRNETRAARRRIAQNRAAQQRLEL